MESFLASSALSYIFYLLLTTALDSLFLSSKEELVIGGVLALIVGAVARTMFFKDNLRFLNPGRWLTFIAFVFGPWLRALSPANTNVAYRVNI